MQAFSGEDIPTAQSRWEMQAHQKWHGIFSAVWFTSKFELKVQKCYFEKLSSSQFLCALICQGYIWRARKIRYIYVDIWTFSDKILWKNNFSTLFNLIGRWCYLSHSLHSDLCLHSLKPLSRSHYRSKWFKVNSSARCTVLLDFLTPL